MRVLLHMCCAVCASIAIERLLCEGHTVTGYFYNPNIHPQDEYSKRLKATKRVANEYGIELVEDKYDREVWFERIKGLEYEAEGGARCEECIKIRIERTFRYFKDNHYNMFTTTLTAGPMKNAELVNRIGIEFGKDNFICANFKKQDGFKRAIEIAKELDLYRQHYCGCVYSQEESIKREMNNEKKS